MKNTTTSAARLQKEEFVADLAKTLEEAKSVTLVNYAGLGVKAQQDLKHRLEEAGGKMLVVKNTLLKLAAQKAGISDEALTDGILSGQTALVLATEDAVAPIQVIGKFSKEFETPKFKVGIVEGSFQDEAALATIATLPGRDALMGQVLGSLMSSMYGLVGTLNSPMQQLVYTLDQKAKGVSN